MRSNVEKTAKTDATLVAFRWAWRFYSPDRSRILAVAALIVGSTLANVLKPWPVALLLDCVLAGRPLPSFLSWVGTGEVSPQTVLILAGMTLTFHLAQAALSAAQNFLGIDVSLRGLARVRKEAFERLQRLSWKFHQGSRVGDLVYRILWDTYSVQTLFQQGAVTFLAALLGLLLMARVMFQIDVGLTVAALSTAPLLILVIRWLGPQVALRGKSAQAADAEVSTRVQQGMQRLPLVQSYNLESVQMKQFDSDVEMARCKRLAQHGSELFYGLGVAAVFALGIAAIVYFGGQRVTMGVMTVGQLFVFLSYLGLLYEPLNQLSHVGSTLATAAAGVNRVREVLEAADDIRDPVNPQPFPSTSQKMQADAKAQKREDWIQFKQVTFSYQPDRAVLAALDLSIAEGEVVGIIGPSGAGKSTLLNLIPRFFDPQGGSVQVGGVDVRNLSLAQLRSQVAVVMQETLLWNGSVAENIAMGREDVTLDQIRQAAVSAGADAFIEKLPQGYDTPIGEGETRLSVGERQRLSLARAFLKDAPILLLDEPTSALDADSEARVLEGLSRLVAGRTTLIVAHRPSTLRLVNRLIVLGQGRIVEQGSPAELLASGGYFRRMMGAETQTPDSSEKNPG